jgi:hypothetical protein
MMAFFFPVLQGVDFNLFNEGQLATTSWDETVRVFKYHQSIGGRRKAAPMAAAGAPSAAGAGASASGSSSAAPAAS